MRRMHWLWFFVLACEPQRDEPSASAGDATTNDSAAAPQGPSAPESDAAVTPDTAFPRRDSDTPDVALRSSDGGDATLPDASVADAGAWEASDDGGPVSDPKRLSCSGAPCRTDSPNFEICCIPLGADAGFCSNAPLNCAVRVECDEEADCFSGTVCCASTTSFARRFQFDRSCLTKATRACESQGGFQLCKTHEECLAGGSCTAKTCGGETFFSCGSLPNWFTCLPNP